MKVLVVPDDFASLSAADVAEAVAGGLRAGGWEVETCPPAELDDALLRSARAVVVGEERLDDRTLLRSVAGEIATRARQAGVPCHAVCARNDLDLFAARILDLQGIEEGSTPAELEAAGRALAKAI
jgi:glycerate kinase